MSDIKKIENIKLFWKRSTGEIITYTEGTLMDIIQRGRTDINSLITTIESLQQKIEIRDNLIVEKTKCIKDADFQLESQKELLLLSQYIMSFHAMRCPLDINNNYSGHEEHLVMYRDVMEQLEPYKGEFDYNKWHDGWFARLKATSDKRRADRIAALQEGDSYE